MCGGYHRIGENNLDDIIKNKATFRENIRNLFAYRNSPNSVRTELLKEIVTKIDKSYKTVGLVGIGLEGAIIKIRDYADTEKVIKIADPHLNEEGRKTQKLFGIIKVQTETENDFRDRFVNGCKIQKELSDIITREQINYFGVPGNVNVSFDPGLYIEMEFIHGVDVIRHIANKKDIKYSLNLYYQLLKSVEFYQNFGYIHRDIKPENIIISGISEKNRKVVIIDWTMSKIVGIKGHTMMGTCLGTLPYTPDKLIVDGEAKDANLSDDVFNLGIMMYEFCNNKKAPKAKNPELLRTSKSSRKQYFGYLRKYIPEYLVPLYDKAIAPEHERFQTVEPFAYEFLQVLKRQGMYDDSEWGIDITEKSDLEQKINNLEARIEKTEEMIKKVICSLGTISNTLNN